MRIGMKLILLLALSAVLFTACSKKTDNGGNAGDGGGCKYTDAVTTNTIPTGVLGFGVESGDVNNQSAKASWTGPSNKVILLRIKAGADGEEVFREIKGSNSIILTKIDGLNLRGVRNTIDAYVYDSVACITSNAETEQIALLDYIRTAPSLTAKVQTVLADKNGDGGTDTGQTDFAVGVALSYTDGSPAGTNKNYTITISTSPTVGGIKFSKDKDGKVESDPNVLPNLAESPADSILLPRAGSGANVVLYDARSVADADKYNTEGAGSKVGNASETTYYLTGDPAESAEAVDQVLYIYTEVRADQPGGDVDTFYTGITENTPEGSPIRFRFGVTPAQVFVEAVKEFSVADDTKSESSDFVFTALTPNYNSDLKDAVQLLQQSADASVSYAVLQLKKAKSGKLYVYSNEEGQMESTCGFLTADNKFVDFSKINDEANETAFELCEFTRQLNLQGNTIALSPSSLEDFVRENIGRGLTLAYVLSYDLAGTAEEGGEITTKEVMDAIAAVDGIGFSHRIFSGVAYAPYDTSITASNNAKIKKAFDDAYAAQIAQAAVKDNPTPAETAAAQAAGDAAVAALATLDAVPNVLPTTADITDEYDTLKTNDPNVTEDKTGDARAKAFSTFLVRANVVDAPDDATVDISDKARSDGTSTASATDLPLVGGVILTLDTSAPVSYPVTADASKVLAGAGDATTTVPGELVAPFGADANIGAFLTALAGKNVLIVRDMVKPGGGAYSDLIYGTTNVAGGQSGFTPSLEREYNANVRSYLLQDALDNSPLRNAIVGLGLDPNAVGTTLPLGAVTPHLYGVTRAVYAISADGANLELGYTYPAYGALPESAVVTYSVTSVSRPSKDKDGKDVPATSTTVDVTATAIPAGDLERYRLTTLTNEGPDPTDSSLIIATKTLTSGLPITPDAVEGSAVLPDSATSSGCTAYILSDAITLPYDFADAIAASAFVTTLVDGATDPDTGIVDAKKVDSGVCLASPVAVSDDTATASLSDLNVEPNILNFVSTVVDVAGSAALPTPNFAIIRNLVAPSSLRAVQNATLGADAQLQGIDVRWILSPGTEMTSYTLTVTEAGAGGAVVYTSAGPALVKGAAEAFFTIPAGNGIVDRAFYIVTLASSGKSATGTGDVTNFSPLTDTVKLDVAQAKSADIVAKLTAGETSADIGKKIVVVATRGFIGRPETTGNAPIATVSALKRARELGIGAIGLTVSASNDTKPADVGLFLAPLGKMGELLTSKYYSPVYPILRREYWRGRASYSCLEMNVEGKKYEYNGGTFSAGAAGSGIKLPVATGNYGPQTAQEENLVSSYAAADLRNCYVRTNQYSPNTFGSYAFTNYPSYGGQDGEKMLEVNDEFVKLLKDQNMVLFVDGMRNMPAFARGSAPEFGTDADKVSASYGAVVKGDEGSAERTTYDLTLAKWSKLLLPFLENDYIQGLVLVGADYENPSTINTNLPLRSANRKIHQYLDLRYVVNQLAADETNNFAFDPAFDVTIDTSLPLVQARSGDYGSYSGAQSGVVKYMQGFFAEWSEANDGRFVKPTTPRFVLPDPLDNPEGTEVGNLKKIIAYAPELDPKNADNSYATPAVLTGYKEGDLALLAERTLIGRNAGNGVGADTDNTFADVTPADGVHVGVSYFPREFRPSYYLYLPTEDGLQDVRKLAEILVPPVPNLRLRMNPMYRTNQRDAAFTATFGFNWHPTDAISGTGAASYGIDFANSGFVFSSAYSNAPVYNYEKGGYASNPGKWDDSLMFVASGYLRNTADTFIKGENIMPLVVALSEFNGLANQEGKLVEPVITNAPLVSGIIRDSVSGAVSFNIAEGVKLDLASAKQRRSSDTLEFRAAYNDLYAKGAQYFVGYEVTVVGDEQNPIFMPLTETDYTGSTAFSSVELPTGSFEFYVRAKYSVPFMDGSGSKDVYSFGVLKNAP